MITNDYTCLSPAPSDSTPGRLAVEVHYYAPFQWCLMDADAAWGKMFYYWGRDYHHDTSTERNSSWGEEAFLDAQFQKMEEKFVRRGIPVILGEFHAMKRSAKPELTGSDLILHRASRTYFHKYVCDAANSRGLKPIYWTIPGELFDWTSGTLMDGDNQRALTGGTALPPVFKP